MKKMIDPIHVLDTNVIIGYATYFENNHDDCQRYFSLDLLKKTCLRVISELGKLDSRRRRLYSDIKNHIKINGTILNFLPSVTLNNNDHIHMKQVLNILLQIPNHQLIKELDRIVRGIISGIKDAKSQLTGESIPLQNYFGLENEIHKWIPNKDDACILSDAVYWAETNSKIVFCSNDYSDIINKSEDVYYCVSGYRGYTYLEKPFTIKSVQAILMEHSP